MYVYIYIYTLKYESGCYFVAATIYPGAARRAQQIGFAAEHM